MLKNYFKIALRNISRNKVFSFINIVGLAAGLAVSFCIIIYIAHEMSYDRQNKNYNRIYRVDSEWRENNFRCPFTCIPLAKTAKRNIPGIESYVQIRNMPNIKIISGSRNIKFENNYFAGPALFDVFTFHFMEGKKERALSDINSVVLSEDAAIRCFGNTDVVGELLTVKLDSIKIPVKVTGVLQNSYFPATIKPDIILPLKLLYKLNNFYKPDVWTNFQALNTYFIINKNSRLKSVESGLDKIFYNAVKGTQYKIMKITFHVVPLSQTYFVDNEFEVPPYLPVIKKDNIIIYSCIALLVLFLACINFIILTTAKSATRNIEFGVRKVIGAGRKDLALLLIFESTLASIIAFPLALVFIRIIFPVVEGIINRNISTHFYENIIFLGGFLLISIIVGLFSGLYTAFTFSRVNPAEIIRKKSGKSGGKANLKKVLISFQMTAFIGLLISAVVLKSQLELTHKKDMGYDIKNFLTVNCAGIAGKENVFKNSLRDCPGVIDMAYTMRVFPLLRGNQWIVSSAENPGETKLFKVLPIGYNYPKLVHMHLIAGKFPSADNFKGKIIINETAAKALGLKSPVGKTLIMLHRLKEEIIGVVKDFNSNSLRDKIMPVAMNLGNFKRNLVVKYSPGQTASTIAFIKSAWSKLSDKPVEITFMNEKIDYLYSSERRFEKAIDLFTILSILIACMGFFGVMYFTTQQRIKEIGIRKILGASVYEIVSLVIKEILILLVVSSIIAGPIAYYFMHKWLQDFAYRIQINWWIFALSFGVALLITLASVLFQVIKAATANPIKALRYE